jgi:hypothetical protein
LVNIKVRVFYFLFNENKSKIVFINEEISSISFLYADVAKLADALDLGSSASRHVGSSPSVRTIRLRLRSGAIGEVNRDGVLARRDAAP